jgi:hypothetical protein
MSSRKLMQLLVGKRPKLVGILQRYYPQCAACSSKQSAAVKASRPALVLHYYGMRPWYYAGAAEQRACPSAASMRPSDCLRLRCGQPWCRGMHGSLTMLVPLAGAFVGLRHYSSPGDPRSVRRR